MWSWTRLGRECKAFAKAMIKLGVEERKAVNIMGNNSPEWAISFYGGILANNVVSGVYITNGSDACQYQAEHSEAQVIVTDTLLHLETYLEILHMLPEVKAVVCYGIQQIPAKYAQDKRLYLWNDFLKLGLYEADAILQPRMDKQKAGMCAVLVYTSGTTGRPKGVMLSHDNMLANASAGMQEVIDSVPDYKRHLIPEFTDCRVLSYLPLSHVAGMQFDLIAPIMVGSQIYFAGPDALQGTLAEYLKWCRPTMFVAVPRIWEKIEDKLKQVAASKPKLLQSISGWAKGHGYDKVMK